MLNTVYIVAVIILKQLGCLVFLISKCQHYSVVLEWSNNGKPTVSTSRIGSNIIAEREWDGVFVISVPVRVHSSNDDARSALQGSLQKMLMAIDKTPLTHQQKLHLFEQGVCRHPGICRHPRLYSRSHLMIQESRKVADLWLLEEKKRQRMKFRPAVLVDSIQMKDCTPRAVEPWQVRSRLFCLRKRTMHLSLCQLPAKGEMARAWEESSTDLWVRAVPTSSRTTEVCSECINQHPHVVKEGFWYLPPLLIPAKERETRLSQRRAQERACLEASSSQDRDTRLQQMGVADRWRQSVTEKHPPLERS